MRSILVAAIQDAAPSAPECRRCNDARVRTILPNPRFGETRAAYRPRSPDAARFGRWAVSNPRPPRAATTKHYPAPPSAT